jgi:hypothetical protein
MLDTLKREWSAKVAVIFLIIYSLWWVYFHIPGVSNNYQSDYFTVTYGLMAAWGSFWGFSIARKWGGFKSIMGKAIIMFSLGLASQEFGQLAYSYYIYIRHVAVPYPSVGDIGFFGTILFYVIGIILLAKAAGVKIGLRTLINKIQALVIPLIMLIGGYELFLHGYVFDWKAPLKVFLDFAYPLGDAIYVSLAVLTYLLSRAVLGGTMKNKILFLLLALIAQFITDYSFLYQTSRGTWQISGLNDFMYFVSYFLMALSLIQLKTVLDKVKETSVR